jgi:general secretion pathway protein H
MRPRAFTLIEVLCVVLLIGLLSGAAVIAFDRPLRAARARQIVEEIAAFDAAARAAARRSGRDVEMVIDPLERTIVRDESARLELPAGLEIEQVRTADGSAPGSRVVIRCSPHGISRGYAIHLRSGDFDRWLLVAGLSGQVTMLNDESQVDSILSGARAARRDAD